MHPNPLLTPSCNVQLPLMATPLPNVTVYYTGYRIYSHYRALQVGAAALAIRRAGAEGVLAGPTQRGRRVVLWLGGRVSVQLLTPDRWLQATSAAGPAGAEPGS